MRCIKVSPEFECQGQRSKVKATGDKKNEKMRHFVPESSSGARSSCGILFGSGTRGPRSTTPVGKSAHAV